jgi:hypothetical protein
MQDQCLRCLPQWPALFIRHGSNPDSPAANPTGPLDILNPAVAGYNLDIAEPKVGLAIEARSTISRGEFGTTTTTTVRRPNAKRLVNYDHH